MPVYVTEFTGQGADRGARGVPAAAQPALAEQKLTPSGTSSQSAAFNVDTRLIRVHTTEIVSIAIGANPTASASTARMSAETTEYFSVQPGHLIAVITNT